MRHLRLCSLSLEEFFCFVSTPQPLQRWQNFQRRPDWKEELRERDIPAGKRLEKPSLPFPYRWGWKRRFSPFFKICPPLPCPPPHSMWLQNVSLLKPVLQCPGIPWWKASFWSWPLIATPTSSFSTCSSLQAYSDFNLHRNVPSPCIMVKWCRTCWREYSSTHLYSASSEKTNAIIILNHGCHYCVLQ